MSSDLNLESRSRAQIFRSLGSFWYSMFKQKDLVQYIIALSRQTSSIQHFASVLNNLAGITQEASLVAQVRVPIAPRDVFVTGSKFYEEDTLNQYAPPPGQIVYNQYGDALYGMLLKGVLPMAIQAPSGRLVLGSDFFIRGAFIYFRQDPKTLFPDNAYLVIVGVDQNFKMLRDFFLRTNAGDYSDYVINYYRTSQTPQAFGLALAAVGGLKILRSSQYLVELRTDENGDVIYTFDNEVVRVSYEHDALVVGQLYPQDYIIGSGVRVIQAAGDGSSWWRQVSWRGGISLDPLIQVKGLHACDSESVAYTAGQDPKSVDGSKVHARVKLSDNFPLEDQYWRMVAERETAQGIYLNSMLGLAEESDGGDLTIMDTFAKLVAASEAANEFNDRYDLPPEYPDVGSLPNRVLVNALDLFFQAVLDKRGFVVMICQSQVPQVEEMFRFLGREMPAGCTPIVFCYTSDLPIESCQFNASMGVNESVALHSEEPLEVTETASLSGMASEYVVLHPL